MYPPQTCILVLKLVRALDLNVGQLHEDNIIVLSRLFSKNRHPEKLQHSFFHHKSRLISISREVFKVKPSPDRQIDKIPNI